MKTLCSTEKQFLLPKSNPVRQFLTDEEGATAIEYALILGLIFLAIVTALGSFADSNSTMYQKITTAVDDATN